MVEQKFQSGLLVKRYCKHFIRNHDPNKEKLKGKLWNGKSLEVILFWFIVHDQIQITWEIERKIQVNQTKNYFPDIWFYEGFVEHRLPLNWLGERAGDCLNSKDPLDAWLEGRRFRGVLKIWWGENKRPPVAGRTAEVCSSASPLAITNYNSCCQIFKVKRNNLLKFRGRPISKTVYGLQ